MEAILIAASIFTLLILLLIIAALEKTKMNDLVLKIGFFFCWLILVGIIAILLEAHENASLKSAVASQSAPADLAARMTTRYANDDALKERGAALGLDEQASPREQVKDFTAVAAP